MNDALVGQEESCLRLASPFFIIFFFLMLHHLEPNRAMPCGLGGSAVPVSGHRLPQRKRVIFYNYVITIRTQC